MQSNESLINLFLPLSADPTNIASRDETLSHTEVGNECAHTKDGEGGANTGLQFQGYNTEMGSYTVAMAHVTRTE